MATVIINSDNPGAVRGAIIDVFEENGYKLSRRDAEMLVFEKQAGKMSDLAYGNWTENRVWSRVKVKVSTLGDRAFRVHCNGFLVRDKGGATEEELKPYRRGPYQKLLDQVAGRFLSPGARKS